MIKVYYTRVVTGAITFAQVPEEYKDDVKDYALARVKYNELSQDDYDRYFGE